MPAPGHSLVGKRVVLTDARLRHSPAPVGTVLEVFTRHVVEPPAYSQLPPNEYDALIAIVEFPHGYREYSINRLKTAPAEEPAPTEETPS
jgi:hypothetical protein